MILENDLEKLLEKLPIFVHDYLTKHIYDDQLVEIVLDLGRKPEARFHSGSKFISQKIISWQDLDYITKRISRFSNENRAGIERTLHRISCIRNRQFLINGLTCRIGRAIFGTISVIRDLLELKSSILILGKPGIGKTTIIREITRILADEIERRVVVIDTSNEIAGESDIPHLSIGRSRRMQVARSELQHKIMLEAVENHMPEVIIIDEIGSELEVLAIRTIAEKGVQLIGTTHGNCLENLIKNPSLVDLIGGIQYVTLSDDEAKRRGTQKSVLERKFYPTFGIIIEINSQNLWTVHEDIKITIDSFLRNSVIIGQARKFLIQQKIKIKGEQIFSNYNNSLKSSGIFYSKNRITDKSIQIETSLNFRIKNIIIFPYSLPINLIKEILLKMGFRFTLTNKIKEANIIIGLKKHIKQNKNLKKNIQMKCVPIYSLNKISVFEIKNLLKDVIIFKNNYKK